MKHLLNVDHHKLALATKTMGCLSVIWVYAFWEQVATEFSYRSPTTFLYISALAFPAWITTLMHEKAKQLRAAAHTHL